MSIIHERPPSTNPVPCSCQCGEMVEVPIAFQDGLLRLQKLYEDTFITCYIFFREGHLDNNIKSIREVTRP